MSTEERKYRLFHQVIEKTVAKGGIVTFNDRTLENYDEVVGYSFLIDDTPSVKGSRFVVPLSIGKEDLLCQNYPIELAITTTNTPILDRALPVPPGLPAKGNLVEGVYQDGNQGVVLTYTLRLILILKRYV